MAPSTSAQDDSPRRSVSKTRALFALPGAIASSLLHPTDSLVSGASRALELVQDGLIKVGEYGLGSGMIMNVAESGIIS